MSDRDQANELMSVYEAEHDRIHPAPAANAAGRPGKLRRYGGIAWNITSWMGVIAAAIAVVAIGALILVPRAMGWQGMVVLSGSMEPALETGGLAFVDKLSQDELGTIAVGDIITFKNSRSDTLVSHRVVEIDQDVEGRFFITKGDANTNNDPSPIREGRVVGKVQFDVPHLGSLVQRLQDRTTYYIFLGIPAALLIASEAWNIVKEVRRHGRDENRAKVGQEVAG